MKHLYAAACCLFMAVGLVPAVGHTAEEGDRERYSYEELSERGYRPYTRTRFLLVSARADIGSTFQPGIGVHHATLRSVRHGGVGYRLGVESVVVLQERRVEGMLVEAVGRGEYMGMGLAGLQLGLGMAIGGGDHRAAGSISVLGSLFFFDLGYRYQFPIFPRDRPEWLRGHFFTIRGHFPAWSGEKQWRDVSDPDSEWEEEPEWLYPDE